MRYTPAILIYSSFVITELHTFFLGGQVQNWIIARYQPMPMEWNVKYATDQLIWIMIAAAMVLMLRYRDRRNKIAAKVLLSWTIFDTFSYFYNYKTIGYGQTYLILGMLIVIFTWGKQIAEKIYSYIR